MSRIVIDGRGLKNSTGRYTRNLIDYLAKIDTKNEYIVLGLPDDFDAWQPQGSNFTIEKRNIPLYGFREQIILPFVLWKLKPDLVHFAMPQQPFVYFSKKVTSVLDLNLVRVKNYDMPKIVFHIKQFVFKLLLKHISRSSKHILTISKFTKDDFVQYTNIDPEKVTVTYCAAEKFDEEPVAVEKLLGKDFIMYVGQSSPYKGQRKLIEAHQQLLSQHPNLWLAIGGKPDQFTAENQKWVDEQGYKNVLFHGFLSDGELAWMYQNAQCYVCPSTNEGFGLLNLEAMVYGAPVASSNATCLPEVSGEAAIYFDPLDPSDIARAVNEVLTDKRLRDNLIKTGAKQHKKYSWEGMAKQTLDVYDEALKTR